MPKDEGVIRYLMKEMDPSEEIEFERCMMEDENLLIEVESLRRTLEKTKQLPRVSPPQNLTEKITQQAGSYRQKQLLTSRIQQIPYIQFAAAAVIIVAFGITYSISLNDSDTGVIQNGVTTEVEAVRPVQNQRSSPPVLNGITKMDVANAAVTPEPWVDRNNLIRFAESSATNGDMTGITYQEDMESSYSKLTPIEDSIFGTGTSVPSIQYTGSRN